MNIEKIGNFIKERRTSLNLTQEDLAELSKISARTIHLIEQGTGNPSFETLNNISEVLGLEVTLKIKQVN